MTSRAATLVARTRSVEETRELAAAVARVAQPGDLVLLSGDLGAGKTAFVQGFGRGLGVTEPITSPTFTLAQQYEGRLTVHHLDVYRLDQLGEVADLGLAELLDDGGVVLIEWGDAIAPVLPNDHLEVRLVYGDPGDGDDDRRILVRPVGPSWAARQVSLLEALAPWAVAPADGAGGTGTDPEAETGGAAPC
ncbi:MAG TPA: tRNA (adenosine(37)-N6)-threonylcarbamoyltransferase complex ATPase subunit type 1 TsaE [Acidimicrobiales bacterium]|nr:tRNA (adenosine(37)-N6)-threonylcarbamoyltransferase complex ATPase subunit type 1 TsaE [Acidimicrobiales bacterium]